MGCLSFPGIYIQVARPQRLIVRAQDVDGSSFTLDVMDLEARCVSHENDHLDGELFINYLSPLKRDLTKRKIKSGSSRAIGKSPTSSVVTSMRCLNGRRPSFPADQVVRQPVSGSLLSDAQPKFPLKCN
jgi:hypothetical protein